jgi:hypothetical protein
MNESEMGVFKGLNATGRAETVTRSTEGGPEGTGALGQPRVGSIVARGAFGAGRPALFSDSSEARNVSVRSSKKR